MLLAQSVFVLQVCPVWHFAGQLPPPSMHPSSPSNCPLLQCAGIVPDVCCVRSSLVSAPCWNGNVWSNTLLTKKLIVAPFVVPVTRNNGEYPYWLLLSTVVANVFPPIVAVIAFPGVEL